MDSSAGGCPPESDQSVKNLREMLAPLLGGGARARLCTMKGDAAGTDEFGKSYATPYKADGWETTLEFPRRDGGCYLNAVKYGDDLDDTYDKVRDFIEAYSTDCKEPDSSRADAALYCPSIGAHANLYIDKRHDRIVVDVDRYALQLAQQILSRFVFVYIQLEAEFHDVRALNSTASDVECLADCMTRKLGGYSELLNLAVTKHKQLRELRAPL
jgi:hypothetical protein